MGAIREVSVIIPTCNRANLVKRALHSVLEQTFRDFEVIVVDDASQDNTKEVVASFADERVKYIKHDKNRGGSAARNSGIKAAKGKYIAFLDDDDEWMPTKIEKQVRKFTELKKNVGVVYCGYCCVYDGRVVKEVLPKSRGNIYEESLMRCIINGITPLVRRECFDITGYFDESLPSCQDWDMWIRVAKYYDVDFVPEIEAKVHMSGSQVSAGLTNRIEARKMILEKYMDDLKGAPSVLSYHLQRLGSLYALAGSRSEGLRFIRNSIRASPLNWRRYLHFFLLLFSSTLYKKLLYRYGVQKMDNIILYH